MKDIQERHERGQLIIANQQQKKIKIRKILTYSVHDFPRNLSKKNIHIDKKKSAILLPIGNQLVPVHVSVIKNAIKHQENDKFVSLRFNFHTPGVGIKNLVYPADKNTNQLYIKELTFRSTNYDGFGLIIKQIKEMQRKIKLKLTTNLAHNDSQLSLRNKIKIIGGLKMRPTLSGRKTTGQLTAYENGLKFISKKNKVLQIGIDNIKHAIYQPCRDTLIVILHFKLKNKVLVNKKLTDHV